MRIPLLLLLAVSSTSFSYPSLSVEPQPTLISTENSVTEQIMAMISPQSAYTKAPTMTPEEIQAMLVEGGESLSTAVIEKVLTSLKCANTYNVQHNQILTIIDYSLPSSVKRLWVFDLNERKLLFHTYVSHGIKSGTLLSTFFSNKFNSKSSSIGVFKTEKIYHGRHGLSLQLDGLEAGFNNNASGRAVVMHGGWYVDENFIFKYGRAGRSWGCPALPENLTEAIINTVKDNSLFVVYYPSDAWFAKSKFLNCDKLAPNQYGKLEPEPKLIGDANEQREEVLFARISAKHEEPIVTVSADDYARLFHKTAPLERMLRRQINNAEYVALSNAEFEMLAAANSPDDLNTINFVIPVIKNVRGYYETQMHIVDLGKIKQIHSVNKNYTIDFDLKPSIQLRATNQFIRWVGL